MGQIESGSCYSGFPAKCKFCNGEFHITTDKYLYIDGAVLKGDYFVISEIYGPKGLNWTSFPENDSIYGENVCCPQCGNAYDAKFIFENITRIKRIREEYGEYIPRCAACETPGSSTEPVLAQVAIETMSFGICEFPATDLSMQSFDEQFLNEFDGSFDGEIQKYSSDVDKTEAMVLELAVAGKTQAAIAETLQLSLYRVRQILNGLSK